MKKIYRAIGLMSGTSLDGIDAALIETDGYDYVKVLGFAEFPYEDKQRKAIRAAFGRKDRDEIVKHAEIITTQAHIEALDKTGWQADIIGFHGQTILHNANERVTLQIGDGEKMAQALGMDVVSDFRSADVAAGGQGAPLAPLYHQARMKSQALDMPVVILNIGGVGNVTYITQDNILAFDTGPGNALMDDWVQCRTGARYDEHGVLAEAGCVDQSLINQWMNLPYFTRKPPKSLDRDEWDISDLGPLTKMLADFSDADGAATLLEFSAQGVKRAEQFFSSVPKAWYVCGGGKHNKALMNRLGEILCGDVYPVEMLGWNGDAVEAECFAYLAVRSALGEPLSLPTTTGVPLAQVGGVLHKAL